MSENESSVLPPAPPAPEAPVETLNKADFLKAAVEALGDDSLSGDVDESAPAAKEEKPVETKSADSPEKAPEKKEEAPIERGFKALAEKQAALRKEQEALKEREARIKKYEEAEASGDPFKILEAHGSSWKKLADRIMQGDTPVEPDKAAKSGKAPSKEEESQLVKQVEEMRAQLAYMQAKEARAAILADVKEVLKDSKYELVREMAGDESVIKALTDHFQSTGQPPSPDMRESIAIVAQALTEKLGEEEKKWDGYLTKKRAPAKNVPSSQEPKSAAPQAKRVAAEPLTYRDGSSPRPPSSEPEPKTPAEYRAAALKQLLAETSE